MHFFRDIWSRPWLYRQPPSQHQNYYEENHQRVVQELVSQEYQLAEISRDNQRLKSQVARLNRRHLADAEKIQRQDQLLCQARDDASKRDKQHHEELKRLYTKLNSLQTGQERLTDEQIQDQMHRLLQNLESWIKSNFRDATKLATSIESESGEFPRTSPQRRAWVQAYIAAIVYQFIFEPYQVGIQDDPWGQFIFNVEAGVQSNCSEATWQNWRVATGIAIENITRAHREAELTHIIDRVEEQFNNGASTDAEPRKQQLRKFVEKCSTLKNILSRQSNVFAFYGSATGVNFSEESMTRFGSDGETSGKVRLCLWPGLMKGTISTGYEVLEHELVWTMD